MSFYVVASTLIFDSLILFILETLTDECRLEKLRIPFKIHRGPKTDELLRFSWLCLLCCIHELSQASLVTCTIQHSCFSKITHWHSEKKTFHFLLHRRSYTPTQELTSGCVLETLEPNTGSRKNSLIWMPSPGAPARHRNQPNRNERVVESRGNDRVYKLKREECYLLQTFIKTLPPASGPAGHWAGPLWILDPSDGEIKI